jgi:hypothetical protein
VSDVKAEVSKIIAEHRHTVDELHQKLAAIAGVDKERLSRAVAKLKSAHATFEDDAQEFVVHST